MAFSILNIEICYENFLKVSRDIDKKQEQSFDLACNYLVIMKKVQLKVKVLHHTIKCLDPYKRAFTEQLISS